MSRTKRKLLVIVGAGASVEFGLPSVWNVHELFCDSATAGYHLADTPDENLYGYCYRLVCEFFANSPANPDRVPNFEQMLYLLNYLATSLGDRGNYLPTNAFFRANHLPDILNANGVRQPAYGATLANMVKHLMDSLGSRFAAICGSLARERIAELTKLNNFIECLEQEFDVGYLTLNYDNVFELARPGLFTGFDAAGAFDSAAVLGRSNWDFIYHLHGSVHMAMSGDLVDLHAIKWSPDIVAGAMAQSIGRSSTLSPEGIFFPTSAYIAGLGKQAQMLRDPFRAYLAQASRLAIEADAYLFLGYGFGDHHLNAVFNGIRSRRRPVTIIDFAPNDGHPTLYHRDHPRTQMIVEVTRTQPLSMVRQGTSVPAFMRDLRVNHEFEISSDSNTPLAIWYGGFMAACERPEVVLAQLAA